MRVASVHTYPIKGCYRLDHDCVTVEPWGLRGDRRWLIVEPDGQMVTQREEPRLTAIRPSYVDNALLLRTPGAADLVVPQPDGGDPVETAVWETPVTATPAGDRADEWLSEALGRKVRLLWLDDPTRRPIEPGYARPTDRVNFADAYPVLVTTTASLDALNDRLAESGSTGRAQPEGPLPMTRFRPNVVVTGSPAWAEDGWLGRRIRIGSVVLRAATGCDRCVVTTTDQETGERGHEPLRVLGRYRNIGQKLLFGVNAIPDGTGPIAVGDPVEVL